MNRKRVAAYARVSTNSRTQSHSFEFQSYYWNNKLMNDKKYEYIGLFADKGISGKFAERRPQFMALMDKCRKGGVDMIFTKSVQRFARNTEELLTIVRELREIGVAVIFEKENINTLNPDSELYLTIAAALAEEDLSRYSDNVLWSIRDRFQKGECIAGPRLFGYNVVGTKIQSVNEKEAEIVKIIYERYATGKESSVKIAQWLNDQGYVSPRGNKWGNEQVRCILRNEKYKGDTILQKTYVDKGIKKENRGQRDKYYIENSHQAIVNKELWDKVQTILEERKNEKLVGQETKSYPFTSMIECGVCGHNFTHKVNNSGTPCQANFWKCRNAIQHGVKVCRNSGIKESILNDLFVECYNEFIEKGYMAINEETVALEEKLKKLYENEKELTMLLVRNLISKSQYNYERSSVLKEIGDLQEKLNAVRCCDVQKKDLKRLERFEEEKVRKFIRKVIILDWVVTFEFYNGVRISRKYTNGTHGDIRDWQLKQKAKKEKAYE